jgi:hypothetical protein
MTLALNMQTYQEQEQNRVWSVTLFEHMKGSAEFTTKMRRVVQACTDLPKIKSQKSVCEQTTVAEQTQNSKEVTHKRYVLLKSSHRDIGLQRETCAKSKEER